MGFDRGAILSSGVRGKVRKSTRLLETRLRMHFSASDLRPVVRGRDMTPTVLTKLAKLAMAPRQIVSYAEHNTEYLNTILGTTLHTVILNTTECTLSTIIL